MCYNLSESHIDDFGPIQLNTTYTNELIDNDNDEKESYLYMIAFFPLYFVGIFLLIMFYINCIYCPIKKKINNCRYKYIKYFEEKNAPIVNNKLNKKYIVMLNKSNKIIKNDNTHDFCAICMEDITSKELNSNNSIAPDCGHTFHTDCLNQWVSKQSLTGNKPNCPTCRGDIVRPSDIKKVRHIVINVSYDSDSDTSTRTTLSDL